MDKILVEKIKARIVKLESDMLLAEKHIRDGTLMKSSLSGGIIELNRLLKKDKK